MPLVLHNQGSEYAMFLNNQDSEYARFLNNQDSEYTIVLHIFLVLNNLKSDYTSGSEYARVLNVPLVPNMQMFLI